MFFDLMGNLFFLNLSLCFFIFQNNAKNGALSSISIYLSIILLVYLMIYPAIYISIFDIRPTIKTTVEYATSWSLKANNSTFCIAVQLQWVILKCRSTRKEYKSGGKTGFLP